MCLSGDTILITCEKGIVLTHVHRVDWLHDVPRFVAVPVSGNEHLQDGEQSQEKKVPGAEERNLGNARSLLEMSFCSVFRRTVKNNKTETAGSRCRTFGGHCIPCRHTCFFRNKKRIRGEDSLPHCPLDIPGLVQSRERETCTHVP